MGERFIGTAHLKDCGPALAPDLGERAIAAMGGNTVVCQEKIGILIPLLKPPPN